MTKSKSAWEASIKKEVAEIQKHCLRECKKQGHRVDPQCAALEWIEENAADFRKRWENGE